ncbi:hypothetical protein C7T35_08580 [Variovorax sp. WS11]|nr:hypothetical protein C7T35_08580 [Variovorax sp. WS11]
MPAMHRSSPGWGKCGPVGNGIAEDTEQGMSLKAESDQTIPSGVMHRTQTLKGGDVSRKVSGDGRELWALMATRERLCCRAAASRDLVLHKIDRL